MSARHGTLEMLHDFTLYQKQHCSGTRLGMNPRQAAECCVTAGELLTPEQQLQTEREEWRAGLDTVLDSETDLQRLRTRADDLKVELIRIQTPPDPSWPVRPAWDNIHKFVSSPGDSRSLAKDLKCTLLGHPHVASLAQNRCPPKQRVPAILQRVMQHQACSSVADVTDAMQAIEKHLDWLESSLSEMKALADPVTAHGGIGMDASTQQQHFEIIQVRLCLPAAPPCHKDGPLWADDHADRTSTVSRQDTPVSQYLRKCLRP